MPLISPEALQDRLGDPNLRIADVRWWLDDRAKGRRDYDEGHLPGAVFVDLDADLAAPPGPGRHPLPSPTAFAARMAELGFDDASTIVAYDDAGGTIAARLWWMLDDLGHRRRPPARRGHPGVDRDRWRADGGRAVAPRPVTSRCRRLVADHRAATRSRLAGERRGHRCARARTLSRRGRAGRRRRRAHPDRGQPAQRRQPRPGRPVPRRGRAAGPVRAARRRHRHVLRQRRDRVPQRARDAPRRAARIPSSTRLVQRLDPRRRPVATGAEPGRRSGH